MIDTSNPRFKWITLQPTTQRPRGGEGFFTVVPARITTVVASCVIAAFIIAATATPAAAQVSAQVTAAAPTSADSARQNVGWHVVRKGQTLQEITALYLGTADRWRDNAALNPDIKNPHRIEPGQRVRVLLNEALPPRTALLVRLANRVESLLNPLPWQPALVRALLRDADAVRTFENASAQLRFSDYSELTVTEESLVFMHGGKPRARRRDPSQIEIRVGQADYSVHTTTEPSAGDKIEIIIGAATAVPKPDSSGQVRARARVDTAKKAQLMVYDGSSALATVHGTVELATGTGSSVSPQGVASPPEKLLAAPKLLEPAAKGIVAAQRADFRWQAVPRARAYVVEICRDPQCAELVQRVTDIQTTSWRTGSLPEGSWFWRATAVSASGLDGYPSAGQSFVASPVPPDEQPPFARVRFVGPQVTIPERFLIGPTTTITVETGDQGAAGVASWTPTIDGKKVSQDSFGAPWQPGPHSLSVEVVDGAGNRFEHPAVPFTFDPVPPILRWEGSGGHGETQGLPSESPTRAASTSRKLAFEWAPGPDRSWRKLIGLEGSPQEAPRVGIRPSRGSFRLGGTDIEISKKQPLWLEAEDLLSRAVHLSILILDDPREGTRMVVSAVDLLGNTTRAIWSLHASGGKKGRRERP